MKMNTKDNNFSRLEKDCTCLWPDLLDKFGQPVTRRKSISYQKILSLANFYYGTGVFWTLFCIVLAYVCLWLRMTVHYWPYLCIHSQQRWALSVFLNFFKNKKWLFCIFYQVDNLFLHQSYLNSQSWARTSKFHFRTTESGLRGPYFRTPDSGRQFFSDGSRIRIPEVAGFWNFFPLENQHFLMIMHWWASTQKRSTCRI